jgi:hypothetical protein
VVERWWLVVERWEVVVGGKQGRWKPPTSRRDSLVVVEGRWWPNHPVPTKTAGMKQ